jgi:hypothetical protein
VPASPPASLCIISGAFAAELLGGNSADERAIPDNFALCVRKTIERHIRAIVSKMPETQK